MYVVHLGSYHIDIQKYKKIDLWHFGAMDSLPMYLYTQQLRFNAPNK